jgi:hypothetical protein
MIVYIRYFIISNPVYGWSASGIAMLPSAC